MVANAGKVEWFPLTLDPFAEAVGEVVLGGLVDLSALYVDEKSIRFLRLLYSGFVYSGS